MRWIARCPAAFTAVLSFAAAAEVTFTREKLADAKRQVKCELTFSGERNAVVVTVASRTVAAIPYGQIRSFSYEYATHHRVKEGAIVMVASLGAGAIVMLTQSKTHWFTVNYVEGGATRELVLRLDKKDYRAVIDAARMKARREVRFVPEEN